MNQPLKTGILSLLAASALAMNAAAVSGAGTVNAPAVNVRAGSSLDSVVVTTVPRDTALLLSETESENWYKVRFGDSDGYIYAKYLAYAEELDAEFGYGMVLTEAQTIYARPTDVSVAKGSCKQGDILRITGVSGQWLRVEFQDYSGYVQGANVELGHAEDEYGICDTMCFVTKDLWMYSSPDMAEEQQLRYCSLGERLEVLNSEEDGLYKVRIDGIVGYASSSSLVCYPTAENGAGAEIVARALTFTGTPYVYGGTSPSGFDCSGFVYYLYQGAGYNITRRASTIWYDGYSISLDALKAGDPVFFSNSYSSSIEHVGIYVGEGKFIHSPSTGKTVQLDTLESGYYAREYYGAVRIYGLDS